MEAARARAPRNIRAGAWRLASRFWVAGLLLVAATIATVAVLWLWGGALIEPGKEPYLLRDLLADAADIALKLGAVVAGLLGIYRYWYQRHEPLVFLVLCRLLPLPLLDNLYKVSKRFRYRSRIVVSHRKTSSG
jgi:hypothetical protein